MRGIPAVALSCFECRNPNYERVTALVPAILDFLLPHLSEADRTWVRTHRKAIAIRYLEYDWDLNDR